MRYSYFKDWLYYVISWSLISLSLSYTALISVRYFIEYFDLEFLLEANELAAYMVSDYQFLESLVFSISLGTFIFLINLLVDKTNIHKFSFWKIVLLKSVFYTLSVFIVISIVFTVVTQYPFFDKLQLDMTILLSFVTPSIVFYAILLFVFITTLINFIAQINRKLGPGNLMNIFLGKYHQPQVENRIFLFIDLKDSTTIAEKLGHIKYSKFLQSFFIDLNRLVPKYHAQIYQYVGDEVVLTWRTSTGIKNLACIRFFFSFQNRVKIRADQYIRKYGYVPEFKAGIHLGEITVAEVGILKREIAYHGDVINTASRIQDLCNEYDKHFLASNSVVKFIPETEYNITYLDKKRLKGKKHQEEIYSIDEKST